MAKSTRAPKPPVVKETAPTQMETNVPEEIQEQPAEAQPPVVMETAPLVVSEPAASTPLVIGSGSVMLSSSGPSTTPISNVTRVRISYPTNFKGKRWFSEGAIQEVSPQTAEIFVAKGIAQIIE